MLAGEGMSQVVRSLQELLARRTYYSGDLLFSVDILRNVTDTFKRATYVPSADDVQVLLPSGRVCGAAGWFAPPDPSLSPQRFFQVVSFMVDSENKDKWDDAQQVRGSAFSGPLSGPATLAWLPPSHPHTPSAPRCHLAPCTCCVLWKTSFTSWAMLSRPSRALSLSRTTWVKGCRRGRGCWVRLEP